MGILPCSSHLILPLHTFHSPSSSPHVSFFLSTHFILPPPLISFFLSTHFILLLPLHTLHPSSPHSSFFLSTPSSSTCSFSVISLSHKNLKQFLSLNHSFAFFTRQFPSSFRHSFFHSFHPSDSAFCIQAFSLFLSLSFRPAVFNTGLSLHHLCNEKEA